MMLTVLLPYYICSANRRGRWSVICVLLLLGKYEERYVARPQILVDPFNWMEVLKKEYQSSGQTKLIIKNQLIF